MQAVSHTPSALQRELVLAVLRYMNRELGKKPRDLAVACGLSSEHGIADIKDALYRGNIKERSFNALHNYVVEQCSQLEDIKSLCSFFSPYSINTDAIISRITGKLLKTTEREFIDLSDLLKGSYLCQRYSSRGKIINEIIDVPQYDTTGKISVLTSRYDTNSATCFSKGYILPAHHSLLFCMISELRIKPYTYYLLFREPVKNLNHLHGVALDVNHFGVPFASRAFCERLPSDLAEENRPSLCKKQNFGDLPLEQQDKIIQRIGEGPLRCCDE